MDKWIEMYNKENVHIHRRKNKIIIQEESSLTMKVYKSENDAIFASLGVLLLYKRIREYDDWIEE